MRVRSAACAAAALTMTAAPVFAQEALPVHVGGRAAATADGGLAFGWPAVYFEGRFSGSEVRVRFDAPTEHMRLLIDGIERAVFTGAPDVDLTLSDLGSGEHQVRLEKMTESQTGAGIFLGFSVPAGGAALPAAARARQIEFIGDSYSAGYGNTSADRACTPQQIHDLTDTQRAFGPLTARALDADYRVNAYSGFGIVRNYDGGVRDLSLPLIYDRVGPDDPAGVSVTDTEWSPEIVVINLGTNDFSTPVNAGEPWPDDAALRAAYRTTYVDFIQHIRSRQPQARFVLMGSDAFIGDVRAVAAHINADDPQRAVAVHFSGLELTGCDWHPSLRDNQLLSELVLDAVRQIGVWPEL